MDENNKIVESEQENVIPDNEEEYVPVIPDEKIEEKPVKEIPIYVYIICVSVLSLLCVAGVLLFQHMSNKPCIDHADNDNDYMCDICSLVIDSEHMKPKHEHIFEKGVCSCGVKDLNYIPDDLIDYTTNETNASLQLASLFASFLKINSTNMSMEQITCQGTMSKYIFGNGTPVLIQREGNKAQIDLVDDNRHVYKYVVTDNNRSHVILDDGENIEQWFVSYSDSYISNNAISWNVVYNSDKECFTVDETSLQLHVGNLIKQALKSLSVPGIDINHLTDTSKYMLEFKINEHNEIYELTLNGYVDNNGMINDTLSIIYKKEYNTYTFSLIMNEETRFHLSIIYYYSEEISDEISINILYQPDVDADTDGLYFSLLSKIYADKANVIFPEDIQNRFDN